MYNIPQSRSKIKCVFAAYLTSDQSTEPDLTCCNTSDRQSYESNNPFNLDVYTLNSLIFLRVMHRDLTKCKIAENDRR